EDARVLEFDASAAVGGNVEGLALQLRALLAKGKGRVLLYIDGPGHLKNQNLNEHNFFKIMAPYMSRGDVTLIVTADAAERRLLGPVARQPRRSRVPAPPRARDPQPSPPQGRPRRAGGRDAPPQRDLRGPRRPAPAPGGHRGHRRRARGRRRRPRDRSRRGGL